MSVIVKLLSKFDDSGIRKAKSSFGGLKKTIGALGIGLGFKAVTDGLLEAAKAASADQKSMQLLNNQLKKNANATDAQVKQNDKFIESLSNQVGIVDDNLRPAMGKLVRATGSVGQAQKLLKLALDASVVSGKPLDTVAQALSKAYNGNTTALTRMFPELKKSKNALADLRKEVEGAAAQQADPFQKFNVAMDNLKEKLGYVILPYLTDFIDKMMKPGGAIDQVGQFLDDVSNPKTDAGQTFLQIKDAVSQTVKGIGDFFALFGNGDAVKGFANIATALIKALPALLALKGIMMLASAGKAIQSLVTAVTLIRGGGAADLASKTLNVGTLAISAVAATQLATLVSSEMAQGTINKGLAQKNLKTNLAPGLFNTTGEVMAIPYNTKAKDFKGMLFGSPAPQVTINVNSADPKATVDAVSQYIKQNGGKMPSSWGR
jgi:hypothetical protein